MTSEIDFYRMANVLVKRYGEGTALEAAQRACDVQPVLVSGEAALSSAPGYWVLG